MALVISDLQTQARLLAKLIQDNADSDALKDCKVTIKTAPPRAAQVNTKHPEQHASKTKTAPAKIQRPQQFNKLDFEAKSIAVAGMTRSKSAVVTSAATDAHQPPVRSKTVDAKLAKATQLQDFKPCRVSTAKKNQMVDGKPRVNSAPAEAAQFNCQPDDVIEGTTGSFADGREVFEHLVNLGFNASRCRVSTTPP